ncbi:DsbA family oxidoreductase [Streptomyces barkulensis]|uniref:DsbA family oxidoreductase n=1 Tax=Streptomyces barkulensis TaxID=1257026 RepID=UPI000C6CA4D3|nr:DsbA family oxidoreductase [Streptomyces barkulensis]
MKITMVLDVVCAHSYIAYTRLARVLRRHREGGGTAELEFRPFQLAPDAPDEPEPLLDALREAFGPGALESARRIAQAAAREGLDLRYERAVGANTFHAHRLIAQAAAQGRAEEMVERLFRAHFTDGLYLGDPGVLARLAEEAGVTVSEGGEAELRQELESVRALGVRAVPVFEFEGGPTLTGEQSEEAFAAALRAA